MSGGNYHLKESIFHILKSHLISDHNNEVVIVLVSEVCEAEVLKLAQDDGINEPVVASHEYLRRCVGEEGEARSLPSYLFF